MISETPLQTDLPSLIRLRAATNSPCVPTFRIGFVMASELTSKDMVGDRAVFELMPGAEIHLLRKPRELLEGHSG